MRTFMQQQNNLIWGKSLKDTDIELKSHANLEKTQVTFSKVNPYREILSPVLHDSGAIKEGR